MRFFQQYLNIFMCFLFVDRVRLCGVNIDFTVPNMRLVFGSTWCGCGVDCAKNV